MIQMALCVLLIVAGLAAQTVKPAPPLIGGFSVTDNAPLFIIGTENLFYVEPHSNAIVYFVDREVHGPGGSIKKVPEVFYLFGDGKLLLSCDANKDNKIAACKLEKGVTLEQVIQVMLDIQMKKGPK
jgi:hypothetical protein